MSAKAVKRRRCSIDRRDRVTHRATSRQNCSCREAYGRWVAGADEQTDVPGQSSGDGADHAVGRRSVVAALAANVAVAATKFVGFVLTGSSSMLAESFHSAADSGNQALLLLGSKRAEEPPSQDHPFGRGRERYFWAFVVGLVIEALSFRTATGEAGKLRRDGDSWLDFLRTTRRPTWPTLSRSSTAWSSEWPRWFRSC